MRITLVHNPEAGRGEHEADELITALTKAGHSVIYQSSKNRAYEKALKNPGDLVLAAGGDGTVGKVARHLVGTKIPLSVLPLGTANNLARTLGFTYSAKQLIARLESGQLRGFDVGLVRGPWGKQYIFEGAGGGLFADYLGLAEKKRKKTKAISKRQEMRHHISRLRRLLFAYSVQEWELVLDGEDFSRSYLLWEAMNIRSIGPGLTLAPAAETGDGQFNFVAARETDRSLLTAYLRARSVEERGKLSLPVKKFTRLKLVWKKFPLHFDDKLWPEKDEDPPAASEIEIVVKPSALMILQRETSGEKRSKRKALTYRRE